MSSRLPLQDIRVLDLSRLLPGPFCTLVLADLGAEVVKLEDTKAGDYLRGVPPAKAGLGGAFYALNRGKKSIAVDLKKREGRQLALKLVEQFDVVVETFRPGVLDRLGLGYDVLQRVRPEIVLCSISGYGQDGPYRDRAGHDINYLAAAGVLAASAGADNSPATLGVQLADVAGGGLWAAIRILAALRAEQGAHLDVSMTEGALSFLVPWFGAYAFSGEPLRRGGAELNGGAARYGSYRTADGKYLSVGALEPKFWAALRSALGQPADMADLMAPPARQQELAGELSARFAERDRDRWAADLADADACVEPVLEMEEVAQHPQHQAREMFFEIDDPQRGSVQLPRLPLGRAPHAVSAAPLHGEHTAEVLRRHGLADDEIEQLLRDKVIRG